MDRDPEKADSTTSQDHQQQENGSRVTRLSFLARFGTSSKARTESGVSSSSDSTIEQKQSRTKRSTLGILADEATDEVPGTVIFTTKSQRHKSTGKGKAASAQEESNDAHDDESAKKTTNGKIVLNPQPEDTPNDPLNWPIWRRNVALICLGYYSMLGGGMTTVLAAGFSQVAETYDVTYSRVALTTGLYMLGLGVGSVIFSPTAYLFGKRPVYLLGSLLFVLTSVWCAVAPDYTNLVIARVFQGIAVSPVECLPSATIAEIFFLHERAFRIGIYTLLLLGGKNLIPLVSAAIIQAKGWRWVFWVVAITVGFGGMLLFFFVPETLWDRTPRRPKLKRDKTSSASLQSRLGRSLRSKVSRLSLEHQRTKSTIHSEQAESDGQQHAEYAPGPCTNQTGSSSTVRPGNVRSLGSAATVHFATDSNSQDQSSSDHADDYLQSMNGHLEDGDAPPTPSMSEPESLTQMEKSLTPTKAEVSQSVGDPKIAKPKGPDQKVLKYTTKLRDAPPVPYLHTLKPWNGRVSDANWLKVCVRPFILFAYPAVLWSAMVYALSVGWLIVISEGIAHIYETRDAYNFSSIQVGLVYLSPFVGGVLGTAVAGRFSDVIVRFMARRNHGVYEPEFRLVMGIPTALCTAIGLMGFGWSAEERDNFMIPTVFFGIVSFGCCIGSTTAITFCLDSHRQFAGEALVTLNFSKNIFHGLIWSLFFPQWLQSSGPKTVFVAIGGIQVACLLFTVPMYIYGKRARMWTVRKQMMARF